MEQQAVVEPVEEVGYKNRPPLLEDVSIEGPTRTPIPHALDTLEQREAIETDYNWWRYSKFALPWLLLMLVCFATLFVMTGFEQAGDVHGLRDGYPTYYQLNAKAGVTGIEGSPDKTEGNMSKVVRNLRIAEVWLCFIPCVLAFLILFSKPRPVMRKILLFICIFILFAGMVIAWAAFGLGESETKKAKKCPEMYLFTNEKCDSRESTAHAALALDFLIAITAITGVIVLTYTTITGDFKLSRSGWRQQERDAQSEGKAKNKYNIKPHHVHSTRLALTCIVLVAIIFLTLALAVMIVVLHQDHNTITLRGYRGRTTKSFNRYSAEPFEEAGWSARNTRLRYSLSGIGILAVLLNLVPWRSRVLAYIFAFIYFVIMVLVIVNFALDIHELREARRIGCPSRWFAGVTSDLPDYARVLRGVNCINSPYVACAIVEFFTAIIILIYLFNEYIIRYKSIHSQRKYPWYHIRKVETELDSKRPVRCEITTEVMTASEYYYRHRFLTEAEMLAAGGQHAPDMPPTMTPYH